MKKMIYAVILSMAVGCGQAYAHSPSKVILEADKVSGTLKVTAVHNVRNPQKHYIYLETISLNGEKLEDKTFDSQTNKMEQDAEIVIPGLHKGDVVEVTANCNMYGKKTAVITVE